MISFKQFINDSKESPVFEFIPKGKKDGTVCADRMNAKDKGKTDGDKIIAWEFGNCTGKLYTLTFKNGRWN